MNAPSGYAIEVAMSAWQSARARLLADDPDLADDEAMLSRLLGKEEGEITEILARLLRAARAAEDLAGLAADRKRDLQARHDRFKRRGEAMRAAAFAIMDAIGERRIDLPDLTASMVSGRPAVLITDETAIPDDYVRLKREPDKTALMEALRRGDEVPGCVLSNSLPSIQIRSK